MHVKRWAAAGLLALIPTLLSLQAPATPVLADGPITATITKVENKFPREVVFSAEAASTAGDIRSVRFRMTTGRGLVERGDNFEITPGRRITADFALRAAGDRFIPAGAVFTYWIEVQDAAGNTFNSDKQQFWYADTRFQWSKLQDGPITVYYYGNGESDARNVLSSAKVVQAEVGQMLGVSGNEFTVMMYGSTAGRADVIGAQREESSATRAQELIRMGVAYSAEDVVQVQRGGGSLGTQDTARHEIAHLYVNWAAGSGVPTWLNEGLAVWAQATPGREYLDRLDQSIRRDNLLLVRGMESFPGDSDETLLAYGQSWSLVNYLIDKHGKEKFRQFMTSINQVGSEAALKQQYGFAGYDDFDAKWREAVGAQPRSYASARPTPIPVFGDGGGVQTGANTPGGAGSGSGAAANPYGQFPVLPVAGVALAVIIIIAIVALTRSKKPAGG